MTASGSFSSEMRFGVSAAGFTKDDRESFEDRKTGFWGLSPLGSGFKGLEVGESFEKSR